MTFTMRDICWLILVIGVALGCWLWSAERTEMRIASDIDREGVFYHRKHMAVLFPLRDKNGKFDGRMVRFWTQPHNGGNAVYRVDYCYPDGFSGSSYPYIAPPERVAELANEAEGGK